MNIYIQSDLPNWIEACAAVALAVLTLITLLVLKGYADDTKTIAKNGKQEIENSQMPFIAVVERNRQYDSSDGRWKIKNQGFGPAINIHYTRSLGQQQKSQWVPPLAPSEHHPVDNESIEIAGGFKVDYESLSGKTYHTLVERENGELKHTFQRPE